MTSKLINISMTLALSLLMVTPSMAAIEINEDDFGPSYETMAVDTVVGKPLQLVNAITGTALYLVSLPFSAIGGNADVAHQKLVVEPWQAMGRCLGCSVAEDNVYKTQDINNNQVRIVVDQPSEIIINTNDNVVVVPQ